MKVGAQIAGWYVQCESLPTADLVGLLEGDWRSRFGEPQWTVVPEPNVTNADIERALEAGSPEVGVRITFQ